MLLQKGTSEPFHWLPTEIKLSAGDECFPYGLASGVLSSCTGIGLRAPLYAEIWASEGPFWGLSGLRLARCCWLADSWLAGWLVAAGNT